MRELQPDDVDAIVELSVRAREPVFDAFRDVLGGPLFDRFYPDWRTQQARDISDALAANLTWVAICDGIVEGFVNVIVTPHEASGEINMIAVDPSFQRRGVAATLIDHALDVMRGLGLTLVTIGTGTDPGHAPARHAYESAGFHPWPQVLYVRLLEAA